jgi:hypothetical protein
MYAVATTLAHARDHVLRPVFGSWHRQLVANPQAAARNRVTRVLTRLPTRPVVVLRSNAYLVQEYRDHPGPEALRHVPGQDRILDGLFADERYFRHHRAALLDLFAPSRAVERRLRSRYGELLTGETVSVSVRRGDFVGQGVLRRYDLELDWYREALELVPDVDRILVFSDDPAWCHDNVDLGPRAHVVDSETDYEDLYLTSWCTHHVICNSSFAWWAAWLGYDERRTVVQPAVWLTEAEGARRGGETRPANPQGWIEL